MGVRFNPPITVLAILAIGLGISTIASKITDCAFAPNGSLRTSAISKWFTKIDYDFNEYRRTPPPCDVWAGEKSPLPIGTVELYEETPASGQILARIYPDGSGLVAIYKPYYEKEASGIDPTVFPEPEKLRQIADLLEFSNEEKIYQKVSELLGPMRGYRPRHWLFDEKSLLDDKNQRALFQLDNPMIQEKVCRREIETTHWSGIHIFFGSEAAGGRPRVYVDGQCDDIAYRSAAYRRQRAYELIVEAADAEEKISIETPEKYPECSIQGVMCRGMF